MHLCHLLDVYLCGQGCIYSYWHAPKVITMMIRRQLCLWMLSYLPDSHPDVSEVPQVLGVYAQHCSLNNRATERHAQLLVFKEMD